MKRSIYLSDQDEQALLLIQRDQGGNISEIVAAALRLQAATLGYTFVPATWVKGGE